MDKPVVLIVDDEPANLSALSSLLSREYQVRVSKSGGEALELAQRDPLPEIILLDVMMPDMDGFAVITRLKETSATAEIPVIFVTALDQSFDEEKGFACGAVDYIAKPIHPAIVRARVRTHLEIKHARDRLRHQNQWLEDEVSRRTEEALLIQNVSLGIILGLAETRDTDTGQHIVRTRLYVETLARELMGKKGFESLAEPRDIQRIGKAAPLHDIGKIGIPDTILRKPGKLTDEEWQVMRTHTTIGAAAIQNAINGATATLGLSDDTMPESMRTLELARVIALTHHEKWDGSGYPHGLSGGEIPAGGRIMALADVYDALVTPRVYKRAWTSSEAADWILSQKGAHFDPAVVAAFKGQVKTFVSIGEQG